MSLTAPTGGSVVNVGAAVALRATASDPGGSVARVDFFDGAQLVASDATSPYEVTWTAGPAGAHSVTAVAIDNLNAVTTSAAAAVSVVATGARVNVALAANGATATASTTYNVDFPASAAIDGSRSGAVWRQRGTWEDSHAELPDWLQINFSAPATIDQVNVFSMQEQYWAPVDPTPALTSFRAAQDFQVESWNGAAWVVVPGGQVVGNTRVWAQVSFAPITTAAIRIVVTKVDGRPHAARRSRSLHGRVDSVSTTDGLPRPPPSDRSERTRPKSCFQLKMVICGPDFGFKGPTENAPGFANTLLSGEPCTTDNSA